MDLAKLGSAFVDMEIGNWTLVLEEWPNLGRRYYERAEQVFQRWLSEMREAGVVSPLGLVISCGWLIGFVMAHFPRPLRWLELAATLLWAAGLVRASARGRSN